MVHHFSLTFLFPCDSFLSASFTFKTSSSSGDRRVAAPLAPPPVRSVVDSRRLCFVPFRFLFGEDLVVEELESLRIGVVWRFYHGSIVC
ncbi:hypothetical protein Bca52824_033557 [Brassica carinata]|uniref:Uncharacterized protein n=1 Tax=Brassica carinata TaxID=52824 RepID=A0A8X7V8L9_BRACI|nr:hypothetical protein Bca52824_033557 [Brassica carinata]